MKLVVLMEDSMVMVLEGKDTAGSSAAELVPIFKL